MKKILLLFVASLLCMGASAQKLISFGPKVGTNISFASGSADIRGGKAKLNAGLFIEVRPIKPLGVCLEVNYSGQEFSLNTYQDNGVALTTRYNLGYLEIPALVNLYLWRGLTLKAGLQAGIRLSGEVTTSLSGGIDNSVDPGATLSGATFSIPVGIGYSFKWGLMVDARYNIGLTKISSNKISGINLQSKVITVSVGWRF